jgi:hypothetical protein
MSNITLFPTWKQAVLDANQQFDYGDTITFQWLREAFQLPEINYGSREAFQKAQFDFLEHMDGFRETLLCDHKKALRNIRGIGYVVVQPRDHAELAKEKFRYFIAKGIEKAEEILENTAFDRLTQQEMQENRDAQAKIAAFKAISRRQLGEEKEVGRIEQG